MYLMLVLGICFKSEDMFKLILTACLVLSWLDSFSQENIDYHPKSLFKELGKYNLSKNYNLDEIKIPDSIVNENHVKGKIFFMSESNNEDGIKYIYIGRVNSCRAGGCAIPGGLSADLDQEYFDYYILYDCDIIIKLVKVFNYQATHGQEVTVRGWLKQFIGYDGRDNLQIGKDIDTISGATISVYAITSDIQIKTKMLKDMCGRSLTLP